MTLIALSAFTDNYIWMLHDGHQALVVDPGDAAPVLKALTERELSLVGILVTHHHSDHVDGIAKLRPHLQGPVYGPWNERIPSPYTPLRGGEVIGLLGCRFTVMDVPGHTAGHIAYLGLAPHETPLLFCGDTLFSGGCGRLFEGTAAQMHRSLSSLASLPCDTRVCCAHEYTLSNLKFALEVEPHNPDLKAYAQHCQYLRNNHQPTLPSTIGQERLINPFLRCDQAVVIRSALARGAGSETAADILAALRLWKQSCS